jgi:HlyD family secretion protein
VEAGRLVEKKVATGLQNWNFTEITSGLAAGEKVVVSLDRPEVKAGARVVIAGEVEK